MPTTIKQNRQQLGLSQADMAKLMGIHYHTWVKWERGENKPTAAPMRTIEILLILKNDYPKIFDKIAGLYIKYKMPVKFL